MALSVNTNVGALSAMGASSAANKSLEVSMARLASGKRINSAADDAAGVAITSRLTGEVKGTNMAIRNASDAQSLINTAEGGLIETSALLQRMREVAVQAGNDTNSSSDRDNLQAEMTALTAEIDRIANVTTWAGVALLDGNAADASSDTNTGTKSLSFQIGSGTTDADILTIDIDAAGGTALGIAATSTPDTLAYSSTTTVDTTTTAGTLDFGSATTFGDTSTFTVTINGTAVATTMDTDDGWADDDLGMAGAVAASINAANLTGISATVVGGKVTITQGGSLDVTSATDAAASIDTIDLALEQVSTQRAELGAQSNRLDHTISNLTNTSANLQAGLGRIEDADFAAESTNLAKAQILSQAATAMLAQANTSKQGVLQLLQR